MSEARLWALGLMGAMLVLVLAVGGIVWPVMRKVDLEERAGVEHRLALATQQRLHGLEAERPVWANLAASSSTELRLRLADELQLWSRLGRFDSLLWSVSAETGSSNSDGWTSDLLELQLTSRAPTPEPNAALLGALSQRIRPHPVEVRGCEHTREPVGLWRSRCLLQIRHQAVPGLPVTVAGADAVGTRHAPGTRELWPGSNPAPASGPSTGRHGRGFRADLESTGTTPLPGSPSPSPSPTSDPVADRATSAASTASSRSAALQPPLILQAIIQDRRSVIWLIDGIWIDPEALGYRISMPRAWPANPRGADAAEWTAPDGRVRRRSIGESLRDVP